MRHGLLAIANGFVRKVDVMSTAKEKSVVPSNSVSYQRLAKENQHLRHANRCLQERLDQMGDLTNDLILVIHI
jgi:archaellum component FlaC